MHEPSHYIDNLTFKNLNEPVCVYFTYVDADKYDFYEICKPQLAYIKNRCKERLIKWLHEEGFCVVSDTDRTAANPATIVVTDSGIQIPFMTPKEVKKITCDIISSIQRSGFALPRSYAFAVRLEQLASPILYESNNEPIFNHLRHPDGRVIDGFQKRYQEHFIKKKIDEAWSWGLDATARLKHEPHIKDLDEPLYSGRQLGKEPYYIYARNDMEGRYVVFGTASYKDAARYSGYKEQKQRYGFIHDFAKSAYQEFYNDYGMELAYRPEAKEDLKIETMIVPGINPYQGAEVYMGTRYFAVPENDEEWGVVMEWHRASYLPREDTSMGQRRLNILSQAKKHGLNGIIINPVELIVFNDNQEIRQEALKESISSMTETVKQIKSASQDNTKTNETSHASAFQNEPSSHIPCAKTPKDKLR